MKFLQILAITMALGFAAGCCCPSSKKCDKSGKAACACKCKTDASVKCTCGDNCTCKG